MGSRLVLDAGAVIALSRGEARARAHVERARAQGIEVCLPAVVVAETVRATGPHAAAVNRVIDKVQEVSVVDEPLARVAGALLGVTRSNATIDALIVAEAARLTPAVVLASDERDLRMLSEHVQGVVVDTL